MKMMGRPRVLQEALGGGLHLLDVEHVHFFLLDIQKNRNPFHLWAETCPPSRGGDLSKAEAPAASRLAPRHFFLPPAQVRSVRIMMRNLLLDWCTSLEEGFAIIPMMAAPAHHPQCPTSPVHHQCDPHVPSTSSPLSHVPVQW